MLSPKSLGSTVVQDYIRDGEVHNLHLAAGLRLLPDHPAQGPPGAAQLVEVLLAADDEGLAGALGAQGLGERGAEVLAPDADDAGLADVTALVQIRTRGTTDPRDVDDLADAVFDELHGAYGLMLGTAPRLVHTSLIRRRSSALLGPDQLGRHERTDNYYVTASRPNVYRPD